MPILSKLRAFIFAMLAVAGACAGAAEEDTSALQSLVQAERNFAETATDRGVRASFLQFLSESSVVFTSVPTNGKKLYSGYQDKGEQLSWEPLFAAISSAGDLGCTAGPWRFKKSAADKEPTTVGVFASIWKKQRDNSWKVVLDIGVDDPNATNISPQLKEFSPPQLSIPIDLKKARTSLEFAKEVLEKGLETNGAAAILLPAAEDIWVFRQHQKIAIDSQRAKSKRQSLRDC